MLQLNAAAGALGVEDIARPVNRRYDAVARPKGDRAGCLRNGVAGGALANLANSIRTDAIGAQTDGSGPRCRQVGIHVDVSMRLQG